VRERERARERARSRARTRARVRARAREREEEEEEESLFKRGGGVGVWGGVERESVCVCVCVRERESDLSQQVTKRTFRIVHSKPSTSGNPLLPVVGLLARVAALASSRHKIKLTLTYPSVEFGSWQGSWQERSIHGLTDANDKSVTNRRVSRGRIEGCQKAVA